MYMFPSFLRPVQTLFFPKPVTTFFEGITVERLKNHQKESLPQPGIEPATTGSYVRYATYGTIRLAFFHNVLYSIVAKIGYIIKLLSANAPNSCCLEKKLTFSQASLGFYVSAVQVF